MFDVPKKVLASHALKHLKGCQDSSVFSCWTHSLRAAIEKARELTAGERVGTHNTYLCIIDTKRLPSSITILHTSRVGLSLLDKRISKVRDCKDKFLAYGAIRGLADKAVSYEPHLTTLWKWNQKYHPNEAADYLDAPPTITPPALPGWSDLSARRFGALFGKDFQLPVIAALLAGNSKPADIFSNASWKAYLV